MPTTGIVGFFGTGGELDVIETLPYQSPPKGQTIIHSVDAQGTIVAEIWGGVYRIEPGQSWVHIEESDPTPECHEVTTYRLGNYGLLDSSQIDVDFDCIGDYFDIEFVRALNKLDWSPDGEQIVVGGEEGIVFYTTFPLIPTDHWITSETVHCVAISPDGQTLASAGNSIQLWDISSGQPIGDAVGHSEAPWASLVFSPDSRTLASGNWHGIIQLWDAETGALIGRPWTDYLGWVRDLAFTPDGRVLISSGGDRIIRLWNTETGGIERKLLTRGEAEFVRAMALNPEGTMIASGNSYSSGGERDTVYLWETSTGEMMESMRIEYDQPWSLAFSPDGTLLAGGFPGVGGGQIVLWDLATGEEIGIWSTGGYYAIISDLAFNSDGTELAAYQSSWYPENQRKIWVLDLETNDIARLVHR